MIKPILTEKSTAVAKSGKYTFAVRVNLTKHQVAQVINKAYGVHVTNVSSMNYSATERLNMYRRKVTSKAYKKVVVTLKDKEKIGVFGEEEKKGKKK